MTGETEIKEAVVFPFWTKGRKPTTTRMHCVAPAINTPGDKQSLGAVGL